MIRADELLTPTIPPKQARSQARLERILDSAEITFALEGFENASIAQIMTGARSSVGIFYQRFRSKEDLFESVVTRFTQQSMTTVDSLLGVEKPTTRSAPKTIARVIPILVEVYRQKRGLLRAILLRASVDPKVHALAHRAEQHIEASLQQLLFPKGTRSSKQRQLFRLGYQMLRSTLNTITLFDVRQRAGLNLDDPDLSPQLTEAFLRILAFKSSSPANRPRRPTRRVQMNHSQERRRT